MDFAFDPGMNREDEDNGYFFNLFDCTTGAPARNSLAGLPPLAE
jgi:hypothetical protein